MAQFNATDFSSRKLQGRRFTGLAADGQEAFTPTIEMQSADVLTDDRYIPTSSLPYSGSDQHLAIVSRSFTDSSIVEGSAADGNVLQYHYRHKLTRATGNAINRETFYFLKDEPTSAGQKVNDGFDGLITGSQYTNFINNKNIGADDYASLGNGDAEAALGNGLGYNVIVYKTTTSDKDSVVIGDVVDSSLYVFDYKTGVLSFTSDNAVNPDGGEFVYMTAYRYVGRTLKSQLEDGSLGGVDAADISGSWQGQNFISGSQVELSSTAQGTLSSSVDGTVTIVNLGLETTDNVTFAGLNVGSTNAGTITIGTDASSTVTIGNAANTVTFAGSTSIAGDLIVQGTTTSINTANLNVEDQFLLLNSGSSTRKDGGIVVSSGPNNSGSAFYYDTNSNRWSLTAQSTTNWNAVSETPKQYVVSVSASAAAPSGTPLDFGDSNEYYGMMHVNTDNGDIYIYS